MAFDLTVFRKQFPAFVDPETYPGYSISFWVDIAQKFVNSDRWGDSADFGIYLVVAHHLVLGKRDTDSAEVGGEPGQTKGLLTSKAVDKVSASYDVNSVAEENAGFWNQTRYGQQYFRLARLFGAGGIQL